MNAERHNEVLHWLSSSGLVRTECLLNANARLASRTRRNEIFEFTCPGEKGVFVKAVHQGEVASNREGIVVQLLTPILRERGLADAVPELLDWDIQRNFCAFRLIESVADLRSRIVFGNDLPLGVIGRVGRLFACIHRSTVELSAASDWPAGSKLPWVLDLAKPNPSTQVAWSTATEMLWTAILEKTTLGDRLSRMATRWEATTVIHGDARLENVVTDATRVCLSRRRIVIVDWELSSIGDPIWDIACLVASLLEVWIRTAPIEESASAPPGIRLDWILPRTRCLWAAFVREWRPECTGTAALAVRCTEFAAARLIQYALETTQTTRMPTASALRLLHVAEKLLDEPLVGAGRFLGVSR